MTNNLVVSPVTELVGRPPEHGRIRPGRKAKKNGKILPDALEHWRLTSPDKNAIEQIAATYGGEVQAWDEPLARIRNQWEVITDSDSIEVWVPPNSLWVGYEQWTRNECQRRCNGVMATLPAQDNAEMPCLCNANNLLECKPKTRLQLVIPDINFAGIWRMESGSWDAQREMTSMVNLLSELAEHQRFVTADLKLVQRSKRKKKKDGSFYTARFTVPQLIPRTTAQELVSGNVPMMPQEAVESASRTLAALPATEKPESDDVIDAEIVETDENSWPTKAAAIRAGLHNDDITKRDGKWVRR